MTPERPGLWMVVTVLTLAAAAMAGAVYYAGQGRTGLALAGAFVFVTLGGLGFELARRRSE